MYINLTNVQKDNSTTNKHELKKKRYDKGKKIMDISFFNPTIKSLFI